MENTSYKEMLKSLNALHLAVPSEIADDVKSKVIAAFSDITKKNITNANDVLAVSLKDEHYRKVWKENFAISCHEVIMEIHNTKTIPEPFKTTLNVLCNETVEKFIKRLTSE